MIRALPLLLLLGACTHQVAVTPKPVQMPALPASLAKKADPLPPISGTDVKDLIRDGVETDSKYADVRARLNAIIDAWSCVRKSMNEGKEAHKCL